MNTKKNPSSDGFSEIRTMVRLATLFYMEDLSQREIAKLTGLSRSKVSRLLKKARKQNSIHI